MSESTASMAMLNNSGVQLNLASWPSCLRRRTALSLESGLPWNCHSRYTWSSVHKLPARTKLSIPERKTTKSTLTAYIHLSKQMLLDKQEAKKGDTTHLRKNKSIAIDPGQRCWILHTRTLKHNEQTNKESQKRNGTVKRNQVKILDLKMVC